MLNDALLARPQRAMLRPEMFPESPALRRLRLALEARGRVEGRVEGRIDGALAEHQQALLTVLRARGLEVKPGQEAQIARCSELGVLGGWLTRAVDCRSVAELLASTPPRRAAARKGQRKVSPARAKPTP